MNKSKESYQYGKRIGKEIAQKDMSFLRKTHKWQKLNAVLRELAGYENTKQIYPTENIGYHSDHFRKEQNNCKEKYESIVIPHFRKGLYEGLDY